MGIGPGGPNDNLPKLLHAILDSFIELCGCDGGSIYTVRRDAATGEETLSFAAMVTRSIKLQSVPEHLKALSFKFDDTSLVGRTATSRQIHKVSFAEQLKEKGSSTSKKVDSILHYVTRNILSAPLISPRGDLVGVCQLLNKNPFGNEMHPEFDERDERLFSIVAAQAALAIENSMLLAEQEKLLEGFVNACVTAVEARDPTTSGHSKRVADYTVALTEAVNRVKAGPLREVKFSDHQIREIRFAAMLHDIGKISVKESVLMKEKKLLPHELEMIRMRLKLMRSNLKLHAQITGQADKELMERLEHAWRVICDANEPTVLPAEVSHLVQELQTLRVTADDGESFAALTREEGFKLSVLKGSLSPEERLEIERHVTNTYEILKMVPWSRGLEAVPEIAYRHHEKLDGSGYPCKCGADHIPLQSRMLTICDIYDALSADDRPYKKAVPIDKALDILKTEVGRGKLDANMYKLFVEARIFELGKSARRDEKKAA
jgi:HD-GYP domain-containing protein (c-di-GMP phosphodiesterase class II)